MATEPLRPSLGPGPIGWYAAAIVIGFGLTAVLLAVALRTHAQTGSDHVDGEEPRR